MRSMIVKSGFHCTVLQCMIVYMYVAFLAFETNSCAGIAVAH